MNSVKSMIWVQTPHPVIWHQHQAWLQVWNQVCDQFGNQVFLQVEDHQAWNQVLYQIRIQS